jgi:hypothetical protein
VRRAAERTWGGQHLAPVLAQLGEVRSQRRHCSRRDTLRVFFPLTFLPPPHRLLFSCFQRMSSHR